jgi:hypothetical protein
MSLRRILKEALILALATASLLPPAMAKDKEQSGCGKPPEFVSGARIKMTKEEQEKIRKLRPQGSVAVSISEAGDVVEAKVVRASSSEAADLLLARTKSMKFKARPGCGTFKTAINYNLTGQ